MVSELQASGVMGKYRRSVQYVGILAIIAYFLTYLSICCLNNKTYDKYRYWLEARARRHGIIDKQEGLSDDDRRYLVFRTFQCPSIR